MALGGHEGVIALFEVARGRRHAEILTPAIEFVCAQADIGLDEIGLVAVDVGPGPVHRDARRPGRRQGAGPGAAGADDRDLVARPAGVPAPPVRPRRRARDRRPQGRGVLRHVPPGARRPAAGGRRRRSGPIDELVADLLARSQEALCVGDGALRYRAEILDGLPLRDRRRRPPVGRPARAAGPRPGAARGVGRRRRTSAPSTCASPTPRSTGRPGPAPPRTRGAVGVSVLARFLDRPGAGQPSVEPMRHRHVDPGAGHRGGVVPQAVERAGVPRRAGPGPRRLPHVPRRPPGPGRRRLRRADVRRRRGPRHEHRRAPRPPPRRRRHACCSASWPARRSRGAARRGRWRCGPAARAPRSCTARSASCPAGIRARYYEGTEDAIVMWCHDIQTRRVRPSPRGAAGR